MKFRAMRCAGYDRVDVAGANKRGMQIARVPTYSPTSVAEQAVALAFTLDRWASRLCRLLSFSNFSTKY